MKLAATPALATAALMIGCATHTPDPAPSPPRPAIVEAMLGSVTPRHQLGGTVAPLQNVGISSSLTEPASAVLVREGQRINAGDVLATFDVSDLAAELTPMSQSSASRAFRRSSKGSVRRAKRKRRSRKRRPN